MDLKRRRISRYAVVDQNNPDALAICDRSGFLFNRKDLVKEMAWRGNRLVPTGFLVGKPFVNPPDPQDRTPVTGPDMVPVKDPRSQGITSQQPPPSLTYLEILAQLKTNSFNG